MTKIEWVARPGTKPESWNMISGCTKVSLACDNCYALRDSWRIQNNDKRPDRYEGVCEEVDGQLRWTGCINMDYEALEKPLQWRKERTVFVASMSDLFHEDVPFTFVERVWGIMLQATNHTFLVLTKRAERMRQYVSARWPHGFTPPNIWLGVTAENQEQADKRIPYLLDTPAALRFVSAEPLLEEIAFSPFLEYNTQGGENINGQRRGTLRAREAGALADRPRGACLGKQERHLDASRTSHATGLSSGTQDVKRSASPHRSTSTSLPALQRADPGGEDHQSPERHKARQQAGQSRSGNSFREQETCVQDRSCESRRRTEPLQQIHKRSSDSDQETLCTRRHNSRSPGARVWSDFSDDLEDCPRRSLSRSTGADRGLYSSQRLSEQDSQLKRPIHLIIIGGESGHNARPFMTEWALDIIEQCKLVGVSVFMKQLGSHAAKSAGKRGKMSNPSEWIEELQIREWPG